MGQVFCSAGSMLHLSSFLQPSREINTSLIFVMRTLMPNEAKNMSELASMELAVMCVLHSKIPTLNRRHPNFKIASISRTWHNVLKQRNAEGQSVCCLVEWQQDRYCFIGQHSRVLQTPQMVQESGKCQPFIYCEICHLFWQSDVRFCLWATALQYTVIFKNTCHEGQ